MKPSTVHFIGAIMFMVCVMFGRKDGELFSNTACLLCLINGVSKLLEERK